MYVSARLSPWLSMEGEVGSLSWESMVWSGPMPSSVPVSLGLILATTLKVGRLIIPNLHMRTSGCKQRSGLLYITPLAHSRAKVYSQVCVSTSGVVPMGRKEGGKEES